MRLEPGHFRLGRLNEAAGVCGGRGTYGYSIDFAASGWGGLPVLELLRWLSCGAKVCSSRVGRLDGRCFTSNTRHSRQSTHTSNARAEAHCKIEAG